MTNELIGAGMNRHEECANSSIPERSLKICMLFLVLSKKNMHIMLGILDVRYFHVEGVFLLLVSDSNLLVELGVVVRYGKSI